MSERANGGNSKGKKSKPGNSNAANSTKASLRAPPRITTVQKLHLRLLQVGIGTDRRARADASQDGPAAVRPLRSGGRSSEEATSRDSSPGIDNVAPPVELAIEPPPPPPSKKQVKRTAAQIFRELARCKAEQDEEIKRISALEFVPVTEEVVNKKYIELEEQETLDRAERRMLALLSLENSIVSKEKALEQKKKLGDKALTEKQSLRRLLSDLRRQEQLIADKVRDAVQTMRERARQAVVTVVQQKAAHARQFGEETLAMVREAQKQKEEERQQRALLIQEIRQLETTPLPRFKELDLTETAGHGLLDEMSIVELRERLALLNMQRSAELREKNQRIVNEKRMQEEQMEMAEEVLTRFHEAQALARRQQRERSAQQPPPVTSERLELLQRELEQKRAERLQRAARRRGERQHQRHLPGPTVAPAAGIIRSAPPGVGRTSSVGAGDERRTKSDSCVRVGVRAPSSRVSVLQSQQGISQEFVNRN